MIKGLQPVFCRVSVLCGIVLLALCVSSQGQDRVNLPESSGRSAEGETAGLIFQNAPFEVLLNAYADKTRKILLIDPRVPKGGAITLRSKGNIPVAEYLQAIESVLGMNGIGLIESGDKFLRVVPIAEARKESLTIRLGEDPPPESDALISQLIQLKFIDIVEAEKAIKSFIHSYGQIQLFERTNSILLTDTAANVNRVVDVLKIVDQPVVKLEEPHIIQIRFSKSSVIKGKLEQIIAETQAEQKQSTVPRQRPSGQPGAAAAPAAPAVPGVIRAPRPPTAVTETQSVAEIIEQAEKGLIRGDVKIIDDDRTNILIIITRPENMLFFDKIIQVLDVEMQPDVTVKVIRLEYSKAEDLEATLNSLIGKQAAGKDEARPAVAGDTAARGAALRDFRRDTQAVDESTDKSKFGELSSQNIKILSDKRTNALILMASRADLAALVEIIKEMDTMLQQVMIEVVIVQVDLDDTVTSGIHWVQRGLILQQRNSSGQLVPQGSLAGSGGAGRGDFITGVEDAATLTSIGSWAESSGLSAYFTFFGLNLDAVVRMLESDTRTKIMSSPRIVATDNTKASIDSSDQIYFLKGNTVDQFGNVTPQVEVKDIGLVLEVTPQINESRNVMMEIVQTISDVAGSQQIGDQGNWPVTKRRSFNAAIAVHDRETIVLGGLVRRSNERQKTGVPILSRIPLIGRLFSYNNQVERKSEVVVFITPYVLDTPEAIARNARKHREAMDFKGVWKSDWSESSLAEKTKAHKDEERKKEKEARTLNAAGVVEQTGPDSAPLQPPPMTVLSNLPPIDLSSDSVLAGPGQSPPQPAVQNNAMDALDPELVDFIKREEKRWGKKLERIDREVEKSLNSE